MKRKKLKRNPEHVLVIGIYFTENITVSRKYEIGFNPSKYYKLISNEFDIDFDQILIVNSNLNIEVYERSISSEEENEIEREIKERGLLKSLKDIEVKQRRDSFKIIKKF